MSGMSPAVQLVAQVCGGGRRDSETVGYGEALDFWRVVGFERDCRLALRAEMKVPGEALLEFRIEALNDRQCVLRQSALFRPRGLFGLAYWYSVLPFHAIVFRGMLKGVEREALKDCDQSPQRVSERST